MAGDAVKVHLSYLLVRRGCCLDVLEFTESIAIGTSDVHLHVAESAGVTAIHVVHDSLARLHCWLGR
jgi:hypothetical protein